MEILRYFLLRLILGTLLLTLVACGSENSIDGQLSRSTEVDQKNMSIQREGDFSYIEIGRKVFRERCSSCHGEQAQGAANWRKKGANGHWPAPPLNGTGHAWHHPKPVLREVIKNGSPNGQGNMPAWGDVLTDREIDAVIAWWACRLSRLRYCSGTTLADFFAYFR